MFEDMQSNQTCNTLWLYGTQGYGKSHLLAALVCCLVAKGERVVFIPDCRECVKRPVSYIQAAMIFAWADDDERRQEIMELDTMEMIGRFFDGTTGVVFVIDQLNALEPEEKDHLHGWLTGFCSRHKAVFGSSANYTSTSRRSINSQVKRHCTFMGDSLQ
jgi:NACHT domain-containing protein